MKLTEKYIKKYLADFHYELTREQLEQDWEFDKDPYYKEKDCWKLHSEDRCWLEVANCDIFKAFDIADHKLVAKRLKAESGELKKIGEEDYKESSFCAGVEHEKKVAIAACQKVIDTFYESRFNPAIDYLKIFKDNL
jgi:hypothetical protein